MKPMTLRPGRAPSRRRRLAYSKADLRRPGDQDRSRWLSVWRIVGTVCFTAVYAAVLIWGHGTQPVTTLPQSMLDPDSPETIAALFGFAVFALAFWMHRARGVHRGVLVTAVIAGLSMVLGTVGFWDSSEGQSAAWTPLVQAANLFVGEMGNAPQPVPLSLQVARLGAAVAMFSAAFVAFRAATREQALLRKIHRATDVILVWGLNPHALGVIRSLRATRHPINTIVVLEPDPDNALRRQAEDLGAHVVTGTIASDPLNQRRLARIIHCPSGRASVRWLRSWFAPGGEQQVSLRTAHLLHQHDIRNIDAAELLERALPGADSAQKPLIPPRIIVRIDRVRLAQDFLRRKVTNRAEAFYDTTGLHQMTARELTNRVLKEWPNRVIVTGNTDLTMAFLSEWTIQCELLEFLRWARAQHAWDSEARAAFGVPGKPDAKDRPRLANALSKLSGDLLGKLAPEEAGQEELSGYAAGVMSPRLTRALARLENSGARIWRTRQLPGSSPEAVAVECLLAELPGLDRAALQNLIGSGPQEACRIADLRDARVIPIVLVDPEGEGLLARYRQAAMRSGPVTALTCRAAEPEVGVIRELLAQVSNGRPARPGTRDAVVRTEAASEQISRQSESWAEQAADSEFRIYCPSPFAQGVSPNPLMGNLSMYGPTLTVSHPDAPEIPVVEDNWLRAAEQLNETYRTLWGGKPWPEIGRALRQSNLRSIRSFLVLSQTECGRIWVPTNGLVPAPLSSDELDMITPFEQQSWFEFMSAHLTVYGPEKDREARVNPLLRPWDEGGSAGFGNTRDGLEITQELLHVLGFQPHLDANDPGGWRAFRRAGRVTARRLTKPLSWQTRSGDVLEGKAGDWMVHEPSEPDHPRTVVDSEFQETYRLVEGDTYERTGTVHARSARAGESIQTAEGSVTACAGDWVVRRGLFDWVVPADTFDVAYRPIGS